MKPTNIERKTTNGRLLLIMKFIQFKNVLFQLLLSCSTFIMNNLLYLQNLFCKLTHNVQKRGISVLNLPIRCFSTQWESQSYCKMKFFGLIWLSLSRWKEICNSWGLLWFFCDLFWNHLLGIWFLWCLWCSFFLYHCSEPLNFEIFFSV